MESEGKTGNPGQPSDALGSPQASKPISGIRALSPAEAASALQEFRRLCLTPEAGKAELDRLSQLLRETGYRSESTQIINEALEAASSNPHVGALWIRRLVSSKTWDRTYPAGMDQLCEEGESGRRAVLEFLELASKKRRPALITKVLRRHGRWLREYPNGWGSMARALAMAGCHREAVKWTRDWRQRDATLEALHARARALRALDKHSAAREVLEAALPKPGPPLEKAETTLWLAAEKALAGDTAEADRLFQELKPAGWNDDSVCLFYLTRGMLRVQQADKAARGEAFKSACLRLLDRFRGTRIYRRNWTLRHDYRRCLSRMARDAGKPAAAIAAHWRAADSKSLLLALLFIPGLQLLLPVYLYRLFSRANEEPNPLASA